MSGALGAVGRRLVEGVAAADGFRLHSAVARREAGRDVGEVVLGRPLGVPITGDLAAALDAGPDVLIDYTHPSVVRRAIDLAFERRIPVVIGTTGLFDADFEEIDAACRTAGVGAATGNFSLTAALMQHLARIAARHVPQWEVIEYGKAEKPNVPSGTARELAERLSEVGPPAPAEHDADLIGPPEARGANVGGTRIHSLRLPGYSLSTQAILATPDERLIIRHEAGGSADPYIAGTLLAIRRVPQISGVLRGLDRLLFG